MRGWPGWLRNRAVLTQHQRARIERWRALQRVGDRVPFAHMRWCVVDVESTGLDVERDRLIAIGAVALEHGRIPVAESFHRLLRQAAPSDTSNILIHRIGGTEQLAGEEPAEALLDLLAFVGRAPLVAFHARFDEGLILRAMRSVLNLRMRAHWLDLAELAPVLDPAAKNCRGLDDWMARYGIVPYQRHDPLADAVATAQLLQVLFARATAKGIRTTAELFALARNRRWLGGR